MCKVNLSLTKQKNINFIIYNIILGLNKTFTKGDIEESLIKNNKLIYELPNRKESISKVLEMLLDDEIIHDNHYNYTIMI